MPPDVRLVDVVKAFDEVRGRRDLARDPAGLVLRAARPVGLREDDDAADDRRLRGADGRPDLPRRPRRRRPAAVQARRQHRLPELRALPAHDVFENVAFGLERQGRRQERGARARRARCSSSSTSPAASSASRAALRRPAAARRARARARQPAARAAPRRAARRARPQAPQADAARAEADPARGRDHVRPRHARPGGGDDDGRHDRRHERRPDRAARDAGGALRAARDRVRRRLPRQVEPARRDDHRRRAQSASRTAP